MNTLKEKKTSLLILGITSIVCSRVMLVSFNDPEGPNLLIVTVMAVLVYSVSLIAYLSNLSIPKKLLLAIFIQIIVVTGLYLSLK
jgi:hypothetical protein